MSPNFLPFSVAYISLIFFSYYYYHSDYIAKLFPVIGDFIIAIGAITLIFFTFIFYRHFYKGEAVGKIKISILRIFLIFTAVFLIQMLFIYTLTLPRIYIGPPLVRSSEQTMNARFLKEGESLPKNPELLILKSGDVLQKKHPITLELEKLKITNLLVSPALSDVVRNFFINYLNAVSPMLTVISLAFILGELFFALFIKKKEEGEEDFLKETLSKIAVGIMGIALISFLLAKFGGFNATSVRIAGATILFFGIFRFKHILKSIFFKPIIVNWRYFSLTTFLLILLTFVLTQYVMSSFHNVPVGIDGARVYIKIIHDLIFTGALPPGRGTFPAGLVHGFASLLTFGNIQALMFSPFMDALLSFAIFYLLGKRLLKIDSKIILLLIAFFTTVSMTIFLTIVDHKTEYFALFFSLIGIFYLCEWIKKATLCDLILAAFFIGFAFTAKLTFLFVIFGALTLLAWHFWKTRGLIFGIFLNLFIIVFSKRLLLPGLEIDASAYQILTIIFFVFLLVSLILVILQEKKNFLKGFLMTLIFSFTVAVPVLPWAIHNLGQIDNYTIDSLLSGKLPEVKETDLNAGLKCENKQIGFQADYGRYISYETDVVSWFSKYLFLPWEMTMNTRNPNSNTTDISYIALAFLPVLLVFGFKRKFAEDSEFKTIFILMCSLWFYWVLMGPGVTWYAITAFFLLFLVMGALWPQPREKALYWLLVGFSLFYIFLMANYVLNRVEKVYISVGAGLINQEKFYDYTFNSYREILNSFDAEEYLQNKNYILKAGGSLEYFILGGEQIIFNDSYFDYLTCVYDNNKVYKEEKEDEKATVEAMIRDLKARRIKGIFLSKVLMEDQRPEISKRYTRFYNLLKDKLQTVVNTHKVFYGNF